MKASQGKDFLEEYARYLIARDDDIGMNERFELEEALGSRPTKAELKKMIARLEEREG